MLSSTGTGLSLEKSSGVGKVKPSHRASFQLMPGSLAARCGTRYSAEPALPLLTRFAFSIVTCFAVLSANPPAGTAAVLCRSSAGGSCSRRGKERRGQCGRGLPHGPFPPSERCRARGSFPKCPRARPPPRFK